MDKFKSLVVYVDENLEYAFKQLQGLDEDELHIDTVAYGWHDGGLERALRMCDGRMSDYAPSVKPMFFRGNALFDNIDDAKNYYLADPEIEEVGKHGDEGPDFEIDRHVPFGMVIPRWGNHYVLAKKGEELVSVTIILFWQELI